VSHLAQGLDQWKRLSRGNFRNQKTLAFENQVRVRLALRIGIAGAYQARLHRLRAFGGPPDLRNLIVFRRKKC